MTVEYRDCTSCKGTGIRKAAVIDGITYGTDKKCYSCQGAGRFPEPDFRVIESMIISRNNKLRSSRPKREDSIGSDRAYYVWRMARFHGGVDMRMPVMAGIDVHGDPWVKELDDFADQMAKKYLGSDLKAAVRWGRALGMLP